ncbi:MAG: urea carboxylase [Clostridiales bacterium]
MFKKVLIANRGAIALRIERTLKNIGVKSVAIYTKADKDSLHVEYADEAVCIGDGPVKNSYLNVDLVLKIALELGVDAIHPGYGFLSENAEFAKACNANGIVFIGPNSSQITLFGLKHSAREIAKQADVPLLPGTDLIESIEEAIEQADLIGYPIILKSTAGGGGIGMRVCDDINSLESAYESVKYLSETNFNNDGMFIEKFIKRARHIEVQIFGSSTGDVIAIGERDCSVQRRNQKIVEECPAPNLNDTTRKEMHEAAIRIAKQAGYKSAGTVEFLYDSQNNQFYFLEVNTRLQVEHGVTEEVYGIDLVKWMVEEAALELTDLNQIVIEPKGHSIQARIYAEDCLNNFTPSAGIIDKVEFPKAARLETWIRDSVEVTTLYDPMLAKLIVHCDDRKSALNQLKKAITDTKIYGITTNLQYLYALLEDIDYENGILDTHMLDDFTPSYPALEVLDGGIQSTIQDYPGRIGYWNVGVPPCGPMDSFNHRIGNAILGNEESCPGLEMTLKGGSYKFRGSAWICLTGADMNAKLDGVDLPYYTPIAVKPSQVLKFEEAQVGTRSYLLVKGGFDVPKILDSAATFTLGNFGGFSGRAVRTGDIIMYQGDKSTVNEEPLDYDLRPNILKEWTIGVVPGPHCLEEFLKADYLEQLTSTTWEVHFNSSRTGVRLIGPTPNWSREDGGEAGLHPSNIHDNAYALGALDMTGDMPILLGPDGPSLGGFVCPVTTATAELWKIGQLHSGDKLKFRLLTLEEAEALREQEEALIRSIYNGKQGEVRLPILPENESSITSNYPILYEEKENLPVPVRILSAGDEYLLIEYGKMELDLVYRFRAHALMEEIEKKSDIPYIDLTPGIRSLQVHIDRKKITVKEACKKIVELEHNLIEIESVRIPSRIVHLPLSWDDPKTQIAIDRYQQNVRQDAPWCPSNLEFIRRINGLESIDDVHKVVFDATYLVLGLGDVYLGAPVATPIDPRHRLVTTKYNPARTWTPENAVGIGGAYLCVYGMEGPGGYQFVGRTIQMWNKIQQTKSFRDGKPWLLRFFDQIKFYPVSPNELLNMREDFVRGKFNIKITETTFDLGKYLENLKKIEVSTIEFKSKQSAAFQEERRQWKEKGLAEYISESKVTEKKVEEHIEEGIEVVRSVIPGSIWKVLVKPNQKVKKNDRLVIIESMKMEFEQLATCDGIIEKIIVKNSEVVHAGQVLVHIKC